jgi:hypothetical protein
MTKRNGTLGAFGLNKVEGWISLITSAWALWTPSAARAELELGGSISSAAHYSNNPFLLDGADVDAGSIGVVIAPTLTAKTKRGSVRLAASIDFDKYTRLYGTEDSYSVDTTAQENVSAKMSFRGRAGFSSSVQGRNLIGRVDQNGDPGVNIILPGDDITLNGQRQRRRTLTGGLGFDWKPTSRQTITFDTGAAFTRYPNATFAQDYDYFVSRVSYLQKVSPTVSVGVAADIARTNYDQTSLGDARIYGLQGNLALRLGSLWQLSVGAGASVSRIRQIVGTNSSVSGTGSANLCRKDEKSSFCAFASRSVSPSAIGSVRPLTSIGANYAVRLSQRSSVNAYAGYSRFSGNIPLAASSNGSFSSGITYSNRLNRRLRGTVSFGYADTFRNVVRRESNPSVSLGLSFDLGNVR